MSFRKQSSSSMKKKQPSHKRLINDQYSDYRVDTNSNEFLEVCKAVYFNELSSLDEEISSSEELLLLLQHVGCNPSKKLLEKYWSQETDGYNFKQFCEIAKQEKQTSKRDLMKAFQKIDKNGDGFITHDELYQVLTKKGERMTKAEVKTMMDDADFNGDERLDYEEFCEMMESTTKQCHEMYISSKQQKESSAKSPKNAHSNNQKDEKRKPSLNEERPTSKKSSSFLKSASTSNKENLSSPLNNSEKENTLGAKLKEEPKDLNRWNFNVFKGCFYKEENGRMESHQYSLKVTQSSTIWLTIKPSAPKYGKFCDDIVDTDMTVFVVESKPSWKLVAFTNTAIDGKSCLQVDLDVGTYNVLTFSSGTKLLQEESESGQVTIVKGTEENAKLTKACKDTFLEIFYRCDLDGNGYLSQEEFNEFQLRSSGQSCDDEAWEVVKENFEVTPTQELAPNGFIDLNLMEARDPQGGADELWITIESMGYSRKLQLCMACPFVMELYTKKGKNTLSLVSVSDGGEPLQRALSEAVLKTSTAKSIKNKRDLILLIGEFDQRVTIAVQNQSYNIVGVRLDCSASKNLMSHQNTLVVSEDIEPKSIEIFHHLVAKDKNERMELTYNESIER